MAKRKEVKSKSKKEETKKVNVSVIRTTDGMLDEQLEKYCYEDLKRKAKGCEIITVKNPGGAERSIRQIYENILAGLDAAKNELVYIAEHDCLYSDDYFYYFKAMENKLYYCRDVMYLDKNGFYDRTYDIAPLSTLAGRKDVIRRAVESKLDVIDRGERLDWIEPGIEDERCKVEIVIRGGKVIDIRHKHNFTGSRTAATSYKFEDKYWGEAKKLIDEIFGKDELLPYCPRRYAKAEDVSCIITCRNEALLEWTVANIRRTAGDKVEIIVVYDGWQPKRDLRQYNVREFTPWAIPLGVGPCRDYGIERASGKYVILLDAHMDFSGEEWIGRLLNPQRDMCGNIISCGYSAVLRPKQLEIEAAKKIHRGAKIEWINEKGMPFEPKWKDDNRPFEEIQLLLGACYGLVREYYMDGLYRIWQNAFGWGTSEQVICMVNNLLGGKNILTDVVTGHVYRDRMTDEVPYRHTPLTYAGVFYNRCRLIDLLPIDEDKKRWLIGLVLNRPDARKYHNHVSDLFNLRDDSAVKKAIESRGSFDEYIKKWWGEVKWERRNTPAIPAGKDIRRGFVRKKTAVNTVKVNSMRPDERFV